MKKKAAKVAAKANVKKTVVHSEFFADEVMTIGVHQTPEEMKALFEYLKKDYEANPIYTEEANRWVILRYLAAARHQQKDARHEQDLKRADRVVELTRTLFDELEAAGNDERLHRTVYTAMLLTEAYYRMRLSRHEPNAALGRKDRQGRVEGGRETALRRQLEIAARDDRIFDEYQTLLETHPPREIAARISDRHDLDPSTVRRIIRRKLKETGTS